MFVVTSLSASTLIPTRGSLHSFRRKHVQRWGMTRPQELRRRVVSRTSTDLVAVASERRLNTQRSEELMRDAVTVMPGGVSSPVRAFRSVDGNPIVFESTKGSKIVDVDGNEYIDYVLSFGPSVVGSANDEVIEAVTAQARKGLSFGAPSYLENQLAHAIVEAVPSAELVRFVSSGTEACISAARLMRAYTGREKIVKMTGCYHGHGDSFLVSAGSGVATLGLSDSPGVLKSVASATIVVPYNDIEAIREVFRQHPGEIAGVFLEPVVGNSGFILPRPGYLAELREITRQDGALLLFDEVMTGFRISYGGAQHHFGVTPDLTTLGKVIGGGYPVGAYAGPRHIMEMVAPAGPMYQAGTLSGSPVGMAAGLKTLEILRRPGAYEYLDRITKHLVDGLLAAARSYGHDVYGGSLFSMWGMFFTKGPVHSFEEAKKSDTEKFKKFHRGMLEEGVYLAPSQFEAGFTSLAHTDEDIERTIEAARRVLARIPA
ncbi:glutathione synthase [Cyanidiococcus yangmingshanensis]|uniref:glutamate-1-semialdehyde 2,1-aminomutase n=1 Tax=Cyanidiococcus yangmingshanensis TaxID=2690220 RepID=A0A7J7IRL8_9RHOD|nr:glutathione synthase [Cyanidiococcus yangmingshanensis]